MNGKIKKVAFVMLALALAACASPRGLTSQFLSNDPCTDQVMAGTPYNMDDPFLTLFWRNNCAYKVFSAFHMLGYQTQFFDAIGSAKPQLKSLHRFQSHHGLPITDMVTSDTIRILDSELTLREQKIAPIAKKFLLYDHMQPLHPNDISKDSLAMLFTLPMIVLPQYLQITTEYESVQCINGQCNGSIQDANGNPWPTHPIDITQDYRFVGTIYFDSNVCTNSWLPSAAVIVDTVLHEYAHYLDGTWSSPIAEQPHFGLINAMDFYNIGYYMSSYNNGCALPRSNNLKDWISYYGFVGSRDCASEHLDGYEVVQDWAESFQIYVTAGKNFRAAAKQSTFIEQKYNWLKANVFKGVEYDTDLIQGFNSGCNDVPGCEQCQPGYMSCSEDYIWDGELRILSTSQTAPSPPSLFIH